MNCICGLLKCYKSILHIILMIKRMCYLSIRPLLKALDNFKHHHSISRKKLTYLKKKMIKIRPLEAFLWFFLPTAGYFSNLKGPLLIWGRERRGCGADLAGVSLSSSFEQLTFLYEFEIDLKQFWYLFFQIY